MLLTTQTEILGKKLGEQEAVRLICKTGFDALDYSMFLMTDDDCILCTPGYKNHVLELKAIADSFGVPFVQAHAPFPSYDSKDEDPKYNAMIFERIVRALEISGLLGVKTMVVHPVSLTDKEKQWAVNLDLYNRLLPHCKAHGVKIALENMWVREEISRNILPGSTGTGESFADYLDALDPEWFTACLDLGHCGLVGETAPGMIRALGRDRLTTLHVHDNDSLHDSHLFPYSGKMDWEAITAALGEIGYTGNFTFEADNFFEHYPNELLPDALRLLHSIGRYLMNKIEKGAL